jgi:GalNAc-alpha-(1->4)-GalNAc-alpha-(1->3)-diNAcBac-PP-undecaprenol alpha-1,4-N-acetyl-D-galactosaminyltransferase
MADHLPGAPAHRIAVLLSSMGRGGAERVAATLCNAWARQGREPWLVPTFLGARDVAYPLHDAVRLQFLGDLPEVAAGSGIAPLRKLRALRRWLSEVRPDVVVSFLPNVNVLAATATRGLGLPLIVCERADPAAGVDLELGLHAARLVAYPFASRVCVQTFQAARRLRRRLLACGEFAVIPNPLPDTLTAFPARSHRPARGGTVIGIGRLSPEKGFDSLLRAFHHGFADAPEWRLEIWGDGPLRSNLESQVSALGLGGRARICGAASDPWPVMAAAQIFALTSAYEGFPNAMLEAMALGLPTVSFDCNSGPRDLTDSGRVGVLVPPGDELAMARELRALADDSVRRDLLGHAGASFVRSAFSESAVLKRWDALFSEIITPFKG